jgi:hypothetical protein
MAIDIRASIFCNLGDIIQANISDSGVSEAGLVRTTGACEVVGTSTPNIGTAVTFSYTTPDGVTRAVPRTLYVLSSFANPYKSTTEIQLGCALTYKEGLREVIKWDALDDPANGSFTAADQAVITVPISASSVMNYCLEQLELTATQNPLTNKFSIPEFDYSAGYVQILNDLLVSESYCGFLNANGELEVFSLDTDGGSGPVIGIDKIIDVGGINAGQLPGEAVTVSYSTLKLKQPDNTNTNAGQLGPRWETVEASSYRDVMITYTSASSGEQEYRVYGTLDSTISTTYYSDFNIANLVPGTGAFKIVSGYEKVRKVSKRYTVERTGSVSTEGSIASSYLANGLDYSSSDLYTATTETFTYDSYGNEVYYVSNKVGSSAHLIGNLGVQDWVFTDSTGVQAYAPPRGDQVSIARVERQTETIGDYQRVVTRTYGPWTNTIAGQQAMAIGLRGIASYNELSETLASVPGRLYLLNTSVETRRTAEGEVAPTEADITNSTYANGGDPSNGYRTESKVELQLALGSAAAQRRIEFNLPYAPDDVFTKSGGTYSSVESDAVQKATKYGRVQNKILLANRNGMNVQTAADVLSAKPFELFVVTANGISGVYRTNAMSWTMSGDGIVASTDALFWGGAGAAPATTGSAWFPTSPTITTLPVAPAVVNTAPAQVVGTTSTVSISSGATPNTVPSVGANPQTTLNTVYPNAVAGHVVQDATTDELWVYNGGTWASVGTNPTPAQVLGAGYPTAVSGDGVQDQATDEFWVYDGSAWENVGTNPGPTMTVATTVPVWNETAKAVGRIALSVEVSSLPYPLEVLTPIAGNTRTTLEITRLVPIKVPLVAVALAAQPAAVVTGSAVRVPLTSVAVAAVEPAVLIGVGLTAPLAAAIALAAISPAVRTGASATTPLTTVGIAALVPLSVGGAGALLSAPAIDLAVAAAAPTVVTGASSQVPLVAVSLSAAAPEATLEGDYFGSMAVQLYGWESDFYIPWWGN